MTIEVREVLPETRFGLEDTVVPTDGVVHDPVVEVVAKQLSDEDSDLRTCSMSSCARKEMDRTMGVPYAPAIAS